MILKRGDTFLHRKWLAEDRRSPLRCVVTKVARGAVYWRPADGGGCHVFDIDQTDRYAMPEPQERAPTCEGFTLRLEADRFGQDRWTRR